MPDVFAGVPATVFGRVRGAGPGTTIVIRGRTADGRSFEEHVTAERTSNPAIRAAWARMHLRDLEDRFDIGREDKSALERRIVDISLQNRVLCRFTSFVAVDHEVVNRGGWNTQVTQAVDQPAGWAGGAAAVQGEALGRAAPVMPGAPMPAKNLAAPMPASAPSEAFRSAERSSGLREEKAAPARRMKMAKQEAAPEMDMLMDDEAPMAEAPIEQSFQKAKRAEPIASSSSGSAAPPPPPAARGATLPGALLDKAKDAVAGVLGLGKGKADEGRVDHRGRFVELVELCRRRGADLLGVARELKEKLRLLLEDLAMHGAHDEKRQVDEVFRALGDALATGETYRVEDAMRRTEEVLDRLAGGVPLSAATGGSGGRREFWR
jgi:hypothetical protein